MWFIPRKVPSHLVVASLRERVPLGIGPLVEGDGPATPEGLVHVVDGQGDLQPVGEAVLCPEGQLQAGHELRVHLAPERQHKDHSKLLPPHRPTGEQVKSIKRKRNEEVYENNEQWFWYSFFSPYL